VVGAKTETTAKDEQSEAGDAADRLFQEMKRAVSAVRK
jgi:hypothetical protein